MRVNGVERAAPDDTRRLLSDHLRHDRAHRGDGPFSLCPALGRPVPKDAIDRERCLELLTEVLEAIADCAAVSHESVELCDGLADVSPRRIRQLTHCDELLLELLLLHRDLLEPPRVVQHVPCEVRGIEDDPASEQSELRVRGGRKQRQRDDKRAREES